jgi:nucleoside-diphosphate-sugar epimerase
MQNVFVSGGTGYMGKALVRDLVARGHSARALARPGSEGKVAAGAEAVSGNALEAESFMERIPPADTFVHLVGTSHPAPWKEREFRAVDLASLRASAEAAASAGVSHFVYVSVAHPAPVMKAYIRVRTECEEILASQPFRCTILRPWYVLGPGHWWPVSLKPIYALLEAIPATREGAQRLGLVSLSQMVRALVWATENPPTRTRVLEVPEIRAAQPM